MSDLISRKDAIEAIEHRLAEPAYQHTGEDWYVGMNCAESVLYDLPSTQPERKIELGLDGAETQIEILSALRSQFDCFDEAEEPVYRVLSEAIRALSAHPEPLTDREQRLFLSAMAREEKVCKQVDDDFRYCREPYEEPLVRACKEITRKVKSALWTN